MEYRIARKDDLQQLLKLYKQLNPEEEPMDVEKAGPIWDSTERTNVTKYFVALDNSEVVSACNITLVQNLTREGRPFAIIENVVTDKDHRRQGIGRKVMQNAIEYAKENNCYKVFLLSSAHRTESHKFYESLGFDGSSKKGFQLRF